MKNKKKNKSISMIDESGHEFVLEGRRPCMCEASRHELINNCLNCGRIICEQEGTGPCFTCGTFVLNKQERDLLLSGSDEALKKLKELTNAGAQLDFDQVESCLNNTRSLKGIAASLANNSSLSKAIEHKNKLLEYDKQFADRLKVYDDQVDYFSMRSQNFISDQNRKAIADRVDFLAEKKFEKVDKIMLNLENLTVSDYSESVIKDISEEHRKLEELSAIKTDYEIKPPSYFIDDANEEYFKKVLPPPIYVPSTENEPAANKENRKNNSNNSKKALYEMVSMENYRLKVQDKEMEKIEDKGMCLAVRQPFASLLVSGIKRFEGRNWYNPFKGRLWIYAAQKIPSQTEINEIETFYRYMGHTNFPQNYPNGVIVGCVIVEDCLPNEVYHKQFPECEVDSPYAFICEYPIAFTHPLPIIKSGGKGIYKLDPKVHKTCKNLLGF